MLRFVSLILASIGIVYLSVTFYPSIMKIVSSTGLSWSFAYWLPKIAILALSLIVGVSVRRFFSHQKGLGTILGVVSFLGLLGTSFVLSPIYQEELSKSGLVISDERFSENITIDTINKVYPNFDGIVAIASSTCPHCQLAAKKFSIVKNRKPALDILFVIFSLQESDISDFKQETGVDNINYMLAPDEKGTMDICEGRFPTFVYLQNGKIIHKWTNNELGYPAFSWIENRLK